MAGAPDHHGSHAEPLDSQQSSFENLHDFRLSYSLMDTSVPPNMTTSPFFLDMFPQVSHDDNCLDNCQTLAISNGSRLPHRGGPASALYRQLPAQHFPGFDGAQPAAAPQFQHHQRDASPLTAPDGHISSDQDFYGNALAYGEDNSAHSSCCDSDCNMPDKCSDVACEDTTSACNDQNCPERPDPIPSDFDVTDGAAALISINHAQSFEDMTGVESLHSYSSAFHSRRQSLANLNMNVSLSMGSSVQAHDTFDPGASSFNGLVNMRDITTHVFTQHSDQSTAGCSGSSCLVDSLHDFSICHLPSLENYQFFDQYAANSYFPEGYTECGASISTPGAFVDHFNQHHRHQLVDPNNYSGPGSSHAQMLLPAGLLSSPITNTNSLPQTSPEHFSPMTSMSTGFGKLDFAASPMTVQSQQHGSTTSPGSSMTLSKTPPSESPDTPRTDVTMSPDWEHRCQWRESNGGLCDKVFENINDLFNHVNSCHVKSMSKGKGGYVCQWNGCCRMTDGRGGFPQRSKIERHMQTHVGFKPHNCKQCGAGFSAKQALDQHMLIHSDEKPLVCPVCGKKIRHQSALTMHMRVHTGEKPLQCNICGKRFSESSNLSKHKRTHDEKGRFSCSYPGCDANFHRQDQLRRHRNNCHKDDTTGSVSEPSTPGETHSELPGSGSGGLDIDKSLHDHIGSSRKPDPQPLRKRAGGGVKKRAR